MILTIDIGNTTVNLCGVEYKNNEYSVVFSAKTDSRPSQSVSEYQRKIVQLFEDYGVDISEFEGAVLSGVVPCLLKPITNAIYAITGLRALRLTRDDIADMHLNVDEPDAVGFDRIVDAYWVRENFTLPAVTVDMGTATTFNVINKNGDFEGGIISAGVETGISALSNRTAMLPYIDNLITPDNIIGKNTEECMLIGSVSATAAMVDGLVSRIEAQLGESVSLVLTGGIAGLVEELCQHVHTYDADILPKGLALLYLKNQV